MNNDVFDYSKLFSGFDLSTLKAYYWDLQKLYLNCDRDLSFPASFDEFLKERVDSALNGLLVDAIKFLRISDDN